MVSVFILSFTAVIVLTSLEVQTYMSNVRNTTREGDISSIMSAIAEYSESESTVLLYTIPLSSQGSIEICADIETGSCTNLLDVSVLIDKGYMDVIPRDPSWSENPLLRSHSRYFIERSAQNSLTINAPDAENNETIRVSR